MLPSFLLAGYQEQQRTIAAQAERLVRQQASIDAQQAEMTALAERLRGIEARLGEPGITAASNRR